MTRHITCEVAHFDVPVTSVQAFFERACELIRMSLPMPDIENMLCEEFAEFITQRQAREPARSHGFLRRLPATATTSALTLSLALALFFTASMVYVSGVRSGYTVGLILAFLLLAPLLRYREYLDNIYTGTYYYRMEGLHIGTLLLVAGAGWLGGWLLVNGHTLAFRLVACVPAIGIATSGAKWLLNTPDSRDEAGKLKFGTRSALIGLYLALLGFAFSVGSVLVSEVFPK